jgi:hypothetical protein
MTIRSLGEAIQEDRNALSSTTVGHNGRALDPGGALCLGHATVMKSDEGRAGRSARTKLLGLGSRLHRGDGRGRKEEAT